VIDIAITEAAFDALAATLPLGSVAYEAESQRQGRTPRLSGAGRGQPPLAAMRGRGETFSDALLRLVA
jgi:hypothetical protein